MQIGVDATCWSNRRGYGRFTRALLMALLEIDRTNHYVFFVDGAPAEFAWPRDVEIVRAAVKVPTAQAASANGHRSLQDLWIRSRAFSQRKLDLLFFPSVYSYVPVLNDVPKLVTIHDAIPELHPELVFPTRRSKLLWRVKTLMGRAQAELILTVSDYSRRCLIDRLGIPPARLRVVPEASDPAFRPLPAADRAKLNLQLGLPTGARFLAYVGGFSPHKNLAMLVEVFRELQARAQFEDLYLVLAGDYEEDTFYSCHRQLVAQVARHGLGERVRFPGRLGDEDLVVLLNLADALILPSLSEGFGLPAVEAAACGTPVVATTRSPLPELLGEGIIAVEPDDRTGWREAIARVLSDARLRQRMRACGLERASRLTWKQSARQLLLIFEEVFATRATPA
jgi:glycosyltransferase involved in cell wall biosynthesis